LLGYIGVDVADRGADPESDAVLSIDEMEHLVAKWIVAVFTDHSTVRTYPDLRLLIEYMSAAGDGGCCRVVAACRRRPRLPDDLVRGKWPFRRVSHGNVMAHFIAVTRAYDYVYTGVGSDLS
jgi:hypothetical protein